MSEDRTVILCAELTLAMLGALSGNRAEDCSFCGRGVVLSTEGQRFRAERRDAGEDVLLTCPPCAVEREGDTLMMGGVPGAEERAHREGRVPWRVLRAMRGVSIRDIYGDG